MLCQLELTLRAAGQLETDLDLHLGEEDLAILEKRVRIKGWSASPSSRSNPQQSDRPWSS